jgi:hypothetical protein
MQAREPFPPTTDPDGNLPPVDDGTHAATDHAKAGKGVTQEAVDSAEQPDVDDTNEG